MSKISYLGKAPPINVYKLKKKKNCEKKKKNNIK
jgi:hypothetical protein